MGTPDCVKYLGIWVAKEANMKEHIVKTTNKLAKLMPKIREPTAKKRKILASVVDSILMYGAPI